MLGGTPMARMAVDDIILLRLASWLVSCEMRGGLSCSCFLTSCNVQGCCVAPRWRTDSTEYCACYTYSYTVTEH